MNIVIVESPAKAKTINKYLGRDFTVLASFGHVRDLPAKDGSVRPDEDFAMSWELDGKSRKRMDEVIKALKGADKLILATDPDREGEAISWHVYEILKRKGALKDKVVERVAFNAVTQSAVREAIASPRTIDDDLVEAYLARRALDYLVGFTLSPVLWRKLPGARSAGRVQSVALRLVCERETEIEAFQSQEYWSIEADMATIRSEPFTARLAAIDGKRLSRLDIGDGETARAIETALRGAACTVASVDSKPTRRNPQPPFITSTLQQEASRKLGFSSQRTMQLAQRLYEGIDIGGETVGLITYMRTDGVEMAEEAISAVRRVIARDHGERYVPDKPRRYKTKARNAQEAHEAIRPTDIARTPEQLQVTLDADLLRLYDLIWKRTLASQMVSAEIERTTVDIEAPGNDSRTFTLRATGSVTRFDGFLSVYQESTDDNDGDDESNRLPAMASGENAIMKAVAARQHFTEPPPRYTEASLIRKMEELGIGRPSTYTAILTVLRDRGYLRVDKKRLVPEDKGRLVTAFLESFFRRYVEYDFTANLEDQLDRISNGDIEWKQVLRSFWNDFIASVDDIQELRVSEVLEALNEVLGPHIFPARDDGADPRACPDCANGRLSLKIGRYGAFIGCSNYPECRHTRQIGRDEQANGNALPAEGTVLGIDPESEREVRLRDGRFGPYVERAASAKDQKPDRASLPKDADAASVDLDYALKLLNLPREVGRHPETGEPITAGIGRYGPFVKHGATYANLESSEEVFTVGLNRAVAALAEKQAKGGARRGGTVLRSLGQHPDLGGEIQIMSGRYGPYVKHNGINATLPKGTAPETFTSEQAVELLSSKSAKDKKKRTASRPRKGAGSKQSRAQSA